MTSPDSRGFELDCSGRLVFDPDAPDAGPVADYIADFLSVERGRVVVPGALVFLDGHHVGIWDARRGRVAFRQLGPDA